MTPRGQAGESMRRVMLVRVRDDVIAQPDRHIDWSRNARERICWKIVKLIITKLIFAGKI